MNKKVPMRRCAGCGSSKPKQELVRVAEADGKLLLDQTGKAGGRGLYLCKGDRTCLALAEKKRAFSRGLHREILPDAIEAFEKEFQMLEAAEKESNER